MAEEDSRRASRTTPTKPRQYKFGWFGDGDLGEAMIKAVLQGRKTATACPAYDPEDADLKVGDTLELVDKHLKRRGWLIVTRIELRNFDKFDEALAVCEGTNLKELRESLQFANGREIRPDEEMRIVYFKVTFL